MPLRTIQAQVHADRDTEAVLRDAMFCATRVYNGLMWHLRCRQEETGRVDVHRSTLNRILATLPRAKGCYSMPVQLTRDEVIRAWGSFFALRRNGRTRHNAPGFRPRSIFFAHGCSERVHRGGRPYNPLPGHGSGGWHPSRHLPPQPPARRGICLKARLVVEVESRENHGNGRVAVDPGETVLLAAAFEDGTALLYSGRLIKAVRRYWQKVRSKVKPPSRENPRLARRYREIAHKERRQIEHRLHMVTAHCVRECLRRGVTVIAIGDLTGIRQEMDYGARMNQRLHNWLCRKIVDMLRYKAEPAGIVVRNDVDEQGTSRTCHVCGKVREANRIHRGLDRCRCGWTAQADVNGALNIYERAFPVPPVKGSRGRVARPVVLSFQPGWQTVHEPKRRPTLRASA